VKTDVSSNKGIEKLEAFIRGHRIQVQGLDRPQELRIFYKSAEIEL